jgi:hypothetical protein
LSVHDVETPRSTIRGTSGCYNGAAASPGVVN